MQKTHHLKKVVLITKHQQTREKIFFWLLLCQKTTSRKRTTPDAFKSQHKWVKTTQKNKKPWIEENNDKDDEDEALYITQDTYSKPVDLEIPETSSKKVAPSKKRNTAGTKKTTPAAKKTTKTTAWGKTTTTAARGRGRGRAKKSAFDPFHGKIRQNTHIYLGSDRE